MLHQSYIRQLIFATCLLVGLCASAQTKHGLVIGLGQYKDDAWGTLHGDRDVPIVKAMLQGCRYSDIETLTNNNATKSGILAAFDALSLRCKKGDTVYIHFSGHGQQITDIDGDEEDGWDEAWIPYDAMYAYSDSYHGEKHLIDDEISAYMDRIRRRIGQEGKLLLVVDACHSGDSSRNASSEEQVYVRGAKDDFIIPLEKRPARTNKREELWLTLSACKDYQTNCEVKAEDGTYYGMLSYALCTNVDKMPHLTNRQSLTKLQKFVNKFRRRLPQDITISGITATDHLSDFFK